MMLDYTTAAAMMYALGALTVLNPLVLAIVLTWGRDD